MSTESTPLKLSYEGDNSVATGTSTSVGKPQLGGLPGASNSGPQEIRKYFEHFRDFERQRLLEEGIEDTEGKDETFKQELNKAALKLLNEFLFKSLSALASTKVRIQFCHI